MAEISTIEISEISEISMAEISAISHFCFFPYPEYKSGYALHSSFFHIKPASGRSSIPDREIAEISAIYDRNFYPPKMRIKILDI